MEKDEELKLIQNCRNGRKDDFGPLYDFYVKKIYSFIYYKVQNREAAEDLTSETFLSALDKIKSFDPEKGKFSSWLYRIARNAVIDFFRTKKSHFPIEDIWYLKDGTDILKDADAKRRLDAVKNYLQELKLEQREIIVLRIWEGLSYKEIAEILQKSEAGCKMIFFRAIGRLKKEMPELLASLFIVLSSVGKLKIL